MPVKEENKRVQITFKPKTLECMDEILALRDPKIHTYSQIVNVAVIYFYLAAKGYVVMPEEKGVKENDENN